MNVSVYAVALIVFAFAYLVFQTFLLVAVDLSLAGMSAVLAIQLSYRRTKVVSVNEAQSKDPDYLKALRDARHHELAQGVISATFIGITWGIFAELSSWGVYWIGAGWAVTSGEVAAAPVIELVAAISALVLLGVSAVTLGYFVGDVSARTVWQNYLPLQISPIFPGTVVTCQFEQAYRFSVADTAPPPDWPPTIHSGQLRFFTLLGRTGGLTDRFAICQKHSGFFVLGQLNMRGLVARKQPAG